MKTQGRYASSNQSSVLTAVGLDRSSVFELNLPKILSYSCMFVFDFEKRFFWQVVGFPIMYHR